MFSLFFLFLFPRIKDEPIKFFPYRGIYLTARSAKNFDTYLKHIKNTEINCIVVDLKDGHGKLTYNTDLHFPRSIGAVEEILSLEEIIKKCKEAGLHFIGRFVVFQDPVFARYENYMYAIVNDKGKPWKDEYGILWTDPSLEAVQMYNIEIAKELASRGVPEIQFDYIRFPSVTKETGYYRVRCWDKEKVISDFIKRIKEELSSYNVMISCNLFGYAMLWESVPQEGQNVYLISPYVDIIYPMVYPSHFSADEERANHPWKRDYNLVLKSVNKGIEKIGEMKIIPWLQGFDLKAYNFGPEYIENQINAVKSSDSWGYIIWNGKSDYTELWKLLERSSVALKNNK